MPKVALADSLLDWNGPISAHEVTARRSVRPSPPATTC
jgi:hypothetical protein